MHTAKVVKKTYRAPGGGKRILTGLLLFLSCLMILSGLLRDNDGGLKLEVKITPTPTVLGTTFDETVTSREISIPAKIWYAIQLGSFDSEDSARVLADSYAARGAAGYVRQDGRFRVLAALYPTREDAQTVRQQLQNQHEIDSYVYEIQLPEIILGLNGMAGQLDALEAGLQFLNTALEQFSAVSVSMDRRDLSVEEELKRLAEITAQADTLQRVIAQRCANVKSPVVDNLMGLLAKIGTGAKAVADTSSKGTVALAAQMKYQTLNLMAGVEEYLNTFGK